MYLGVYDCVCVCLGFVNVCVRMCDVGKVSVRLQ